MREVRVHVDPEVTGAALESGRRVELPAAASLHVTRVLRLRHGATLTVFDGQGGEFGATLHLGSRGAATVEVKEHRAIEQESPLRVTLLQGLARGERMDWVIQKATELGVAAIIPVASQRSVVQLEAERGDRRLQHWRAVAAAACEQCGRNTLPRIDAPRDFSDALAAVAELPLRVLLEPGVGRRLGEVVLGEMALGTGRSESVTTARSVALALLVGPEGGWDESEIALAEQAGCTAVRLGPRVLRTETAGLAALAALQCLAGDFA